MAYQIEKNIGIIALLGFVISIFTLIFYFGVFYGQVQKNTKDIEEQSKTVSESMSILAVEQKKIGDNLIYFMGKLNINPIYSSIENKRLVFVKKNEN